MAPAVQQALMYTTIRRSYKNNETITYTTSSYVRMVTAKGTLTLELKYVESRNQDTFTTGFTIQDKNADKSLRVYVFIQAYLVPKGSATVRVIHGIKFQYTKGTSSETYVRHHRKHDVRKPIMSLYKHIRIN